VQLLGMHSTEHEAVHPAVQLQCAPHPFTQLLRQVVQLEFSTCLRLVGIFRASVKLDVGLVAFEMAAFRLCVGRLGGGYDLAAPVPVAAVAAADCALG